MISASIEAALNTQINRELQAGYLYLAMASYYENAALTGFSHWYTKQAAEELEHAMKIYAYINERNGRAVFEAIDAPQKEWDSPLQAVKAAYDHECKVTNWINEIVALARKENDYATENFLQWFVAEQVEEEANAITIVDKLTLMKDMPGGHYVLDKELAARQ